MPAKGCKPEIAVIQVRKSHRYGQENSGKVKECLSKTGLETQNMGNSGSEYTFP